MFNILFIKTLGCRLEAAIPKILMTDVLIDHRCELTPVAMLQLDVIRLHNKIAFIYNTHRIKQRSVQSTFTFNILSTHTNFGTQFILRPIYLMCSGIYKNTCFARIWTVKKQTDLNAVLLILTYLY